MIIKKVTNSQSPFNICRENLFIYKENLNTCKETLKSPNFKYISLGRSL